MRIAASKHQFSHGRVALNPDNVVRYHNDVVFLGAVQSLIDSGPLRASIRTCGGPLSAGNVLLRIDGALLTSSIELDT